jgi:hypothetical protein
LSRLLLVVPDDPQSHQRFRRGWNPHHKIPSNLHEIFMGSGVAAEIGAVGGI